jgi:predicted DNA-binding transcriptional regulator AlpA
MITPLAFNLKDAVAYSGLSRSRLYELMRSRDLPSLAVGGRRMVLRSAIDAYFADLVEASAK